MRPDTHAAGQHPGPATGPEMGVVDGAGRRSHDARPISDEGNRDLQSVATTPPSSGSAADGQDDGMTITQLHVNIRCPSLDSMPEQLQRLPVQLDTTIAQIRHTISSQWPGKPSPEPEALRFYRAGQLLADDAKVQSFAKREESHQDIVMHLVIRPGPWLDALAQSRQERQRHVPVGTSVLPSPNLTAPAPLEGQASRSAGQVRMPLSGLSSGIIAGLPMPAMIKEGFEAAPKKDGKPLPEYALLAAQLPSMDTMQKKTLLEMLTLAQSSYMETYDEIWRRAFAAVLTDAEKAAPRFLASAPRSDMDSATGLIEGSIFHWGSIESEVAKEKNIASSKPNYSYKQVEICGLPFLLRTTSHASISALEALQRRITLLDDLRSRVDYAIDLDKFSDRLLPGTRGPVASVHPPSALQPALDQLRARIDALPNLQARQPPLLERCRLYAGALTRADILTIVSSTLFLATKMALLVYIFTRGASLYKRAAIAAAAGFYVLYESFRMFKRQGSVRLRATLNVPRHAHRRRHEVRGAATRPGTMVAADGRQLAPTDARPPSPRSITIPVAPRSITRTEWTSLSYWISRLAVLGLYSEYREMGFRTPTADGRINPARQEEEPRPRRFTAAWLLQCIQNYLLFPVLLFVLTLVPEIEQRRRLAISKREHIIRKTMRKIRALEAKLHEEEQQQQRAPSGDAEPTPTPTTPGTHIPLPLFLRCEYGRRIIDAEQSGGRQLDLAQELEAAAALAANGGRAGAGGGAAALDNDDNEQGEDPMAADMGFL